MAKDLVCGMQVDPNRAAGKTEYKGKSVRRLVSATPMSSAQARTTPREGASTSVTKRCKMGSSASAKSVPERGQPCKTPLRNQKRNMREPFDNRPYAEAMS